MKLKIKTKNNGLNVSVTDENDNVIEDVHKITIQPFKPGDEFIVANIECDLSEMDIKCYQKGN